MRDKDPTTAVAVLRLDGRWSVFAGPRFGYEPVGISGRDARRIAREVQALRDFAPHIEGGSTQLYLTSLYSDASTRELVAEYVLIVAPRSSRSLLGSAVEDQVFVGPLPSVEMFVMRDLESLLGSTDATL